MLSGWQYFQNEYFEQKSILNQLHKIFNAAVANGQESGTC